MLISSVLVICLGIVIHVRATDILDFTNDDVIAERMGEVVGDELLPLQEPQIRNKRLLMNLGGIFGEPLCTSIGSSTPTGICKNELTCVKQKGSLALSNTCKILQGHCCQYYRECGGSSGEKVVYWQSHGYPAQSEVPGTCRFTLYPAGDVCYIKVEFLELLLDSQIIEQCMANVLFVQNMEEGNGSPFCGPLTGYEMFLKVKYRGTPRLPTNALPLKFFINMNVVPYKFQVRLTQVLCSQVDPFTGGRKKRDMPEVLEASPAPETSWESRKEDHHHEIGTRDAPLWNPPAEKGVKKSRKRQCLKGNARSLMPPQSLPLKFSFQRSNIFTEIVEKYVNEYGLLVTTRVAGGTPITDVVTEFPYLGYVLVKNQIRTVPFFCGAVLIGAKYALTAAHCLIKLGYTGSTYELRVRFGRTDLGSAPVDRNALFDDTDAIQVVRTVIHPMFDSATIRYDLALLELASLVPYSPISLPTVGKSYTGSTVKILGWGYTGVDSGISPTPNYLEMKVLDNGECNELWFRKSSAFTYTFPQYIHPELICAEAGIDKAATCAGDSGGPLVVEESGSYTLVGIMSSSFFGCVSRAGGINATIGELPDVFTRVSEFLGFINVATSTLFD